jgi:hypothetical protein
VLLCICWVSMRMKRCFVCCCWPQNYILSTRFLIAVPFSRLLRRIVHTLFNFRLKMVTPIKPRYHSVVRGASQQGLC